MRSYGETVLMSAMDQRTATHVVHCQLNTQRDNDPWRPRTHRNLSDCPASLLEVWDRGGDLEVNLRVVASR